MNTLAMLIGYTVLTALGLILLPFILMWICAAIDNMREISHRRRVIRLLRRTDKRTERELGEAALDALKTLGIAPTTTLEQAKRIIKQLK